MAAFARHLLPRGGTCAAREPGARRAGVQAVRHGGLPVIPLTAWQDRATQVRRGATGSSCGPARRPGRDPAAPQAAGPGRGEPGPAGRDFQPAKRPAWRPRYMPAASAPAASSDGLAAHISRLWVVWPSGLRGVCQHEGHAASAAVVLGVRATRADPGLGGLRPDRGMQNHVAELTRCLDRLGVAQLVVTSRLAGPADRARFGAHGRVIRTGTACRFRCCGRAGPC
jgi:hypothetical protein